MNIGISLLFYLKDAKKITGILKSYIIKVNRIDEVEIVSRAQEKGNAFSRSSKSHYIGIHDIYFVAGALREGSVLGRTTYYESNKKTLAKSLIKGTKDYEIHGKELG